MLRGLIQYVLAAKEKIICIGLYNMEKSIYNSIYCY